MAYRSLFPRTSFDTLRNEMDRLFTTAGGDGGHWMTPPRGLPAVNLWDAGEAILVEAELPGVKNDQIDVSVFENELTLKVERPVASQENVRFHRRERTAGAFARVLRLPSPVDPTRVSAELRNGVLTITLPKAASAKPRKIQVGVSS